MFTVKHVKANGEEFIIECASFFADRVEGSMTHRFRTFDTPHVTFDHTGLWIGESLNSNIVETETIYVMNRYGATVATHRFLPVPNIMPGNAEGMFVGYANSAELQAAA